MKIGILGSGVVGQTLATGWLAAGHEVAVGTRDGDKLRAWAAGHPGVTITDFAGAARFGAVVVLAVKGHVAERVLELAGADALAGKPVIDACNPIADAPPDHGVLRFFTTMDESLMERLQRAFPAAHFVKAFNSVGTPMMVQPQLSGGRPSMFICGNDAAAKAQVSVLVEELGWDVEDMGEAPSARAIEPLCMLWCIPGLRQNQWRHAFKLLQ